MRGIKSQAQIAAALKFANESTNNYAARGQSNKDKIKLDIYYGKLAEYFVVQELKDKLPGLSAPDINIYSSRKKKFDYDLKSDKFNIHVKAQTLDAAERYGLSWTFQFSDSRGAGCDKKVFFDYSENDIVIFVVIDQATKEFEIKKIIKVKDLQKKFKEPRLEYLRAYKKVIYFEDIESDKDII